MVSIRMSVSGTDLSHTRVSSGSPQLLVTRRPEPADSDFRYSHMLACLNRSPATCIHHRNLPDSVRLQPIPLPFLQGIKNVGIHNLSPGMVTTELLMAGADTKSAKFFINCLGKSA